MLIQTGQLSFPARAASGGNPTGIPSGLVNELVVSQVLAKYSTLVKSNLVFSAYATVTAPVAFTTAAAIGGPLLWNRPNSGIEAHILGVSFSSSVVTTVAGGLGFTGAAGQTAAPTSTTAIDASGSTYLGGAASQVSAFRLGTVTVAGAIFMPFAQFHTGALTVDNTAQTWIDINGAIVLPQGCWASVAGSAALTTLQVAVNVIWAELPA